MTTEFVQQAIAASLVAANLSFETQVGLSQDGKQTRLFLVPFDLTNGRCIVTAYLGGAVLVALTPLSTDPDQEIAKCREVADVLVPRAPLARVFVDPHKRKGLLWIEASVPVPPFNAPIEPWLALAPFNAVTTAAQAALDGVAGLTTSMISGVPILMATMAEPKPVTKPEPKEQP